MTDATRKRNRYREDPDYRAKIIARAAATHARHSGDPDYRRLVRLRKDIYQVRESLTARLEHAARLEKRLLRLNDERLKVEARWKARRGSR